MSQALRLLGEHDLGAVAEIAFGGSLWRIQQEVAQALSKPGAKVVVASCHASGKTYLAGLLALSFFWTYPECIVLTTSSTDGQLRSALWGEIRRHHANARVNFPGRLLPGDLKILDGPRHYMEGLSPNNAEALQGRHSPKKLIVVDEGAAVTDEIGTGLTALLSSGDSRMLVILNPTDDATWAANLTRNPEWTSIPITAWDTPHFTGEPAPPNSSLITPKFLDYLKQDGRGPGTYFWETRVEAKFWSQAQTQLIAGPWYDRTLPQAEGRNIYRPGRRVMGVDLAPYGDAENTIAFREGNALRKLAAYPAMRPDLFWSSVVKPAAEEFKPDLVVFDADGVGAGSIGDAEKACGASRILPFRGATTVDISYRNLRSLWWWRLRERFEMGDILIDHDDPKLKAQLTSLQYSIPEGKIRIETKEERRKRGKESPDRGDVLMYSFSIDPPVPPSDRPEVGTDADVWYRAEQRAKQREKDRKNPRHAASGRRIRPY